AEVAHDDRRAVSADVIAASDVSLDDRRATSRRLGPTATILLSSLRFGRTRLGLALTVAVLLVALAGPLFAPHSPTAFVGVPYGPPMHGALLGTDNLGRDVLSRVLWGGQNLVWMAVAAATLGVTLGTILGMLAGYSRSSLDNLIMRSLDAVLAFPGL